MLHWCDHCGAPMDPPTPEPVALGQCKLVVVRSRPELRHADASVSLTGQEAALLTLLAKRKSVTGETLEIILSPESESNHVAVQVVSTVRRKIAESGFPLGIVTDGRPATYRLVLAAVAP